jgi:membrane dipeptidase
MEDVSGVRAITRGLVAAGYNENDLAKIWGGNALRLLRQAEAKAAHP